MNKLNKNYLVIKNVNQDKNLKQYLEQICQDEKVSILYEEFNQFDLWNNKQSVYSEFNASPSSDILLWSYESCKLDYVNYLYTDFEQRYLNTGKVVNRIIESVDNGDNLDEGEKLDMAIRDDLSYGEEYKTIRGAQYAYYNPSGITWTVQLDGSKTEFQKQLTSFQKFKQKVSNFYENWSYEIYSFIGGFAVCYMIFLTLLTIKNYVIK